MVTRWTSSMTEYLSRRAGDLSPREIGEDLGMTRNSVLGKARRLGVSLRTDEETRGGPRRTALELRSMKRPSAGEPDPRPVLPQPVPAPPRVTTPTPVPVPAPPPVTPPTPVLVPAPNVSGEPVSLLDLGDCDCRWPVGASEDGTARYCGAPRKDFRYCGEHAAASRSKDPPRSMKPLRHGVRR